MNSMHPTRPITPFSVSAMVGLLGMALVLLPAPARAEEERSFEEKFIGGLLENLGLQKDRPQIDYHERAPLVIPSSRNLPPPESANASVNNPAWPNDPDVARAKEAKRQERERRKTSSTEQIERDQRPLRPEEITPGGNPRTPPSGRTIVHSLGEGGERMSPSELGAKTGLFSNMFGGGKDDTEAVRFTGEPPRTALTEPPRGYQTPSPDQPYGPGKAAGPTATNYTETHGTEEARQGR